MTFAHIAGIARGCGAPLTHATACGGGHASPWWRQLQADCMNITLHSYAGLDEGAMTARGAAVLAGVGIGVYPSLRHGIGDAAPIITAPDPARVAVYAQLRERHAELYQSLEPWFKPRRL
jgi:sugar (pentulose or hexulose) kinase